MPPPRLPFPEFVTLVALMFATIAFSVDAMLPALPAIAAELSAAAPNRAQLIITVFILGMGLGTFVAGPVSDALGRKRVVVAGIALYIVAALVAARAQTLEVMLAARFVQGFGAAAPRVVTLAVVRDLYSGRTMARVMSFVMTVFVLVPAIAPAIGAGLQWAFGWRAIFTAFVVFGLVSGSWFWLRQAETLPPSARRPLRAGPMTQALREVLGNRVTLTCIAALSLGFGQMLAYLSSVPQIFAEVFDRQASMPLWFGLAAVVAGTSSLVNARLVMRLGMRRLAAGAYGALALVSLAAMALLALADLPAPWDFAVFVGYMCMGYFAIGLTFGNLNALAMEPMGHIAGLAASVIGAVSTVLAVFVAVPIGLAFNGTALPLVAGVAACSALAFLLVGTLRKVVET